MKHIGVDCVLRRVVCTLMLIQVFKCLGADQRAHGSRRRVTEGDKQFKSRMATVQESIIKPAQEEEKNRTARIGTAPVPHFLLFHTNKHMRCI